ncbi:MBL fold metallo-hydrolase [Planctomycetota bacterium]
MQITPTVHAVNIPFTIQSTPQFKLKRQVNLYIIVGDQVVWLIDAGVAGCESIVYEYLQEIGYCSDDITGIILTHAHPDHIGALSTLVEQTGCQVLAHHSAVRWIEDVHQQEKERPVPGFSRLVAGSTPVNQSLYEGDRVVVGGVEETLDVLHTPGHSAGSISLWLASVGVLFTGDAVCMATGFPVYQDIRVSLQSLRRLAALGNVKHLLGSWDEPRRGDQMGDAVRQAMETMQRTHEAVRAEAGKHGSEDLMALAKAVFRRLELSLFTINPVTLQAIAAHMLLLDVEDLRDL